MCHPDKEKPPERLICVRTVRRAFLSRAAGGLYASNIHKRG
nr:MAG TPA: hypothetical protein [Caudoviricetes sp.]